MTTSATTTTTTTNALTEIYNNFGGGNILCDKAHMEHVTAVINTLEKKKIKYKIIPMPMCGEDGLEITFAIVIMADKKNGKRNKKSISNNKYILFNSWYTKNRSASWPNSHTMWNLMKSQHSAKPFVDIFDFMEKLGKSIMTKKEATTTVAVITADKNEQASDIENSVYHRHKLYDEFYKIATYTFTHSAAPASSFIYDIKLNKTEAGDSGLEKLNRQTLEEGISVFKNILSKQDQSIGAALKLLKNNNSSNVLKNKTENVDKNSASATTTPKNSRKRAAAAKPVKKGVAKKMRESAAPVAVEMEDDQTDDTQMSYS
ncbi:PP31 [Spodoptera cosmioides nucleopolyhedrovirus]|uniref:PP31 n=1 Tax=Spodoptera cosmioides nucleopolyhedrovirus TaxID=2605774 RepID=A0A6B7KID5_9ABAC|nr:PP31 [Spodoptera cosmioides nucleopolyhedrovirus]